MALGITVKNLAKTTFRAHSSADTTSLRVADVSFCMTDAFVLDIKNSSLFWRRLKICTMLCPWEIMGHLPGGCGNSIAESADSFARRQPPIQPVLNALFLLPATSYLYFYCNGFRKKCKRFFRYLKNLVKNTPAPENNRRGYSIIPKNDPKIRSSFLRNGRG